MISGRLATPGALVSSQFRSREIYGLQSGTGAGFLRVLRFPCQFSFHQLLHIHQSSYHRRYVVLILTESLNNQLKKLSLLACGLYKAICPRRLQHESSQLRKPHVSYKFCYVLIYLDCSVMLFVLDGSI
jgi:hypothetical protein